MEKEYAFLLGIVFIIIGSCLGASVNQAGTLQAFLRAKRGNKQVETWASPTKFDSVSSSSSGGAMELDLIANGLPGQPKQVKFNQYAGYITIDEAKGRTLFYYFAESQRDPAADPLVLWLNGGPGCSSVGLGAMLEIGPFGVKADGKTLYARQNAWNKVANTLFVESPAGVGFSYSNTTSDYQTTGDKRTAKDSYTFLVNWFTRFPHYKNTDFYINGESYAGYYIPELADIITQENMQYHDSLEPIKLKGFMIGNGIMNEITDRKGLYDYIWSHALMSDTTYNLVMRYCVYEWKNSTADFKCNDFENEMLKEAGGVSFFNIYGPICSAKPRRRKEGLDPCAEKYIYVYLNLPQVQEAMHANRTGLHYPWNFCSDFITWVDSPSSMFPIYRRLIPSGLQMLLYSGDLDAVVPVTGTRYSIDALNLTVKEPWQPWIDDNGEVGGYRVVYDGLTLATVREAGHEVPKYQPGRALTLFKRFLDSK